MPKLKKKKIVCSYSHLISVIADKTNIHIYIYVYILKHCKLIISGINFLVNIHLEFNWKYWFEKTTEKGYFNKKQA